CCHRNAGCRGRSASPSDHTKPKARELAFRKGDIVTIVEVCEQKGWYQAKHNDTGEEGLLSASSVREREAIRVDPKLSLMPWFHGKISGVEAVQALQPLRTGSSGAGVHPAPWGLRACVSFGKEVIHYRHLPGERLSIDASICFYNLIDMIEVSGTPAQGPSPPWQLAQA
uniref:SH3 domain-containing protein n=1 Tax=Gopherus evgoodei TaxID=1825980 RepID=A0A8C4Y9D4_9SAUR